MSLHSPNMQLGKLDFYDIKKSIIDYLKTQDTLKDYNYAGSAAQVLIDVLAYNTMYYGYYANMVSTEMFLDSAQRIESIISLVKPLGFVVPGKTSARGKAKVRHGGIEGTKIPKFTRFSGYNGEGVPYSFYTIQDYNLNLDGEVIAEIVEGKSLIKEVPLIVDQETQKAFLHGLDIDISTISVEVKNPQTGLWEEWTKSDNIETGLDMFSKVYWLERSELGFFVVFGGNVGAISVTQIGQQITTNDLARVSYLKSNGIVANEVGAWKIHGLAVAAETDTVSLSSGGSDEPNLDMIRFFAPKWFAAQDRAVTVEDCKAFLAQQGIVGDAADPNEVFNVWGGEDMNPPMYGRVFVSVSKENPIDLIVAGETAISALKEKTCVTILPEFLSPEYITFVFSGTVHWDSMRTLLSREQIISLINDTISNKFPKRFNNTFNISEISNIINSVDPQSISTSSSDFNISVKSMVDLGPDLSVKEINFKNELQSHQLTTSSFKIGPKWNESYNIPDNQLIQLRTVGPVQRDGSQSIQAYYQNQNNVISVLPHAGKFVPRSGLVYINPGVAAEPFEITCIPVNSIFYGKENIVSELVTDIQIERINIQ